MVPEYWLLGEDVQDKVRLAGYEAETVEGIAVDIHDVLQAAEKIEQELAPAILTADPAVIKEKLEALAEEFAHIRWHCDAALEYLQAAQNNIA